MSERDQFEAWALSEGYPIERLTIRRGAYLDDHIDDLWSGWEARAKFVASALPAAQEWRERWYGSNPERGWSILCGRDVVAYIGGDEGMSDAVRAIVDAHNAAPRHADYAALHLTPEQAAKEAK